MAIPTTSRMSPVVPGCSSPAPKPWWLLSDPNNAPEVLLLWETIRSWRFYGRGAILSRVNQTIENGAVAGIDRCDHHVGPWQARNVEPPDPE